MEICIDKFTVSSSFFDLIAKSKYENDAVTPKKSEEICKLVHY